MILALLVLLLFAGLIWWLFAQRDMVEDTSEQNQVNEFQNEVMAESVNVTLPKHRTVVPTAPANIMIGTNNLVLNESSSIQIQKDNQDYGEDKVIVEASGRILRRDMDESAPEGVYTVNYRLCSTGRECENGNFQFKIENSLDREYSDKTNSHSVNIDIQNGKFNPEKIIVTQGTRVNWVNRDNTTYRLYPGITEVKDYLPRLNSGSVPQNGNFSFVITEQGYIEYFAENGIKIDGKIIVK